MPKPTQTEAFNFSQELSQSQTSHLDVSKKLSPKQANRTLKAHKLLNRSYQSKSWNETQRNTKQPSQGTKHKKNAPLQQ